MKLVFYSLILNNHQANVADELWNLTGHNYYFVELANLQAEHRKGDSYDYSDRPYLLRAWQSKKNYSKAMELAQTAECCVFSGVQALPFQKIRMKRGLLSFDMSERWLKRGVLNLFSPAILKMFLAYHFGGWSRKFVVVHLRRQTSTKWVLIRDVATNGAISPGWKKLMLKHSRMFPH